MSDTTGYSREFIPRLRSVCSILDSMSLEIVRDKDMSKNACIAGECMVPEVRNYILHGKISIRFV